MGRPAYVVGSCVSARSGSDLQCKHKNKQHTHALFENASASIGPDVRRSHLVYRIAGLSDHPEHEAPIISSSSPLTALPAFCVSLCCSICTYVDDAHTVFRMVAS